MKIIQVDNFDREIIGVSNDRLVAENINYLSNAKIMADALNEKLSGDNSPVFFRVEPDEYKLRVYEP